MKNKQLTLKFKESEQDLFEHMVKQGNKTAYIKELIKRDMEGKMVDQDVIAKVVHSLMSVKVTPPREIVREVEHTPPVSYEIDSDMEDLLNSYRNQGGQ